MANIFKDLVTGEDIQGAIPSLNQILPDKSLVRQVGIITNSYDVEFFQGAFKETNLQSNVTRVVSSKYLEDSYTGFLSSNTRFYEDIPGFVLQR